METTAATKSTVTLLDRVNSQLQNTVFSDLVSIISYAFSPVVNRSLQVALIKICMAIRNVACLSRHRHHCCSAAPTVSLRSHTLSAHSTVFSAHQLLPPGRMFPFYIYISTLQSSRSAKFLVLKEYMCLFFQTHWCGIESLLTEIHPFPTYWFTFSHSFCLKLYR